MTTKTKAATTKNNVATGTTQNFKSEVEQCLADRENK